MAKGSPMPSQKYVLGISHYQCRVGGQKTLIMKIFHNPSISSLKFSRTLGLLAVIFRGPLCIKFDDKFLSNIYFLITSDAKRT